MGIYFSVIVVPDKSISNEISRLSNSLAAKYKVRIPTRYKKVPVHISLLFQDDEMAIADAVKFTKQLERGCRGIEPFRAKIKGFGYFSKPGKPPKYSVYVDVVNSTDLKRLYRMVVSKIPKGYPKPTYNFVPHISLIRGGLNEEKFADIKKECENIGFKRSFSVGGISVGTQKKEGDKWTFRALKFQG